MSKLSSLVLGSVAGAALFSAIQYASGTDMRGTRVDQDRLVHSDGDAPIQVNRIAKADRAPLNIASAGAQGQTLSFHVQGLTDTSVLLRFAGRVGSQIDPGPNSVNSRALPASPRVQNGQPQKATVACEPPVSVLTDIAKLLQPGRCVT